ncbi:hypothetical protein L1987_00055 [Smallanthus sonchifolius]|uniref:Uncharacterized protein n=1 Tax=Smallanthus sonchifolius TaxID=185202 RepID=A0ACB9K1B0_9ASTR|nr:hypothetical protein L1987_00055 [Smallanthus sonchifolius]
MAVIIYQITIDSICGFTRIRIPDYHEGLVYTKLLLSLWQRGFNIELQREYERKQKYIMDLMVLNVHDDDDDDGDGEKQTTFPVL